MDTAGSYMLRILAHSNTVTLSGNTTQNIRTTIANNIIA
jgi:hypothetical protein